MMQGQPGPGGQMQLPPPDQDPLMQITYDNMPFFLYQQSDLVENEDIALFKKNAVGIARNMTFSTMLGVFINVQVKNIPKINFMKWNKFLRLGVRIPLFFLPYGIFYQDFDNKYNSLENMRRKYFTRILRYQKTRDMRYLDPTGALQKKFEQTMGVPPK